MHTLPLLRSQMLLPTRKTHRTSSQLFTHLFRFTTLRSFIVVSFLLCFLPSFRIIQAFVFHYLNQPTLQGNKVFLMLSRQVMRQTNTRVPIKAVYVLEGIGTLALPFGCYVALRSLSHHLLLLQHSSRQLLVSFRYTSFIPSLRSAIITPRS